MKKLIAIISILFLTNCAGGMSVGAGQGFLLTMAKEGVMAINDQKINKTGESCGHNILGIVSWGESSIEESKRDANIKNVATIDRDYFGILGVYSRSCLIINGN